MIGALSQILVQGRDVLDYYDSYDAASASAGAAFFGAYSLVICCCVLGGFLINIFLAYWVYSDAKKHNVENPILWAILTFFFTLIGLLVYFLAIRPQAMQGASINATSTPVTPKKEEKPEAK